jgi:TPR repeat protein
MMDDYDDLSICENFTNIMIDDNCSLNTCDFVKNNLLLNLTGLTSSNIEKIINKLIDHLIRMHDEWGYILIETKEIIYRNIESISRPLQIQIFDWLIKNKTSSKYIFFCGFLYYNGIIVNRDEDKAFGLLLKASKNNYPIAQVYLGKLYKEPKTAFYWYQKSAKNGNKLAQFYLGKCYEYGIGIEKNDLKAFEFYEKAANNGNKIAQLNLGRCYGCGIGIKKDYDKSFEWFERSAKRGHMIAQFCLSILYEKVKKDLEKSYYWIEKVRKKSMHVQFRLGMYHENCMSDQKDNFRPFELCEKLAKQGCYGAIYILGHLYYLREIGIKRNLEKSICLTEKAAKKGDKFAQLYLGRFHEDGIIVEKSFIKAFKWFEKAADNGSKHALLILGYYFERGRGSKSGIAQKDINKAIEFYEKSAKQGYDQAQCCLGYLYEKDEGIDQDLEKAIYWYKKATKNGYEGAHYHLANCYKNGVGIEKNEAKAFKHYKYSVENGYYKGIYMLGYCYENGIGTDIDKEMAINLYKFIAKDGNMDARERLKRMLS